MPTITIFCHVVDHFGDAGVCLRLAKGLAARGALVELVIDQLGLVHRMAPDLSGGPLRIGQGQLIAVEQPALLRDQRAASVPDLTIEAFQYDAPEVYRIALEQAYSLGARPQRVLLDYLATEDWAAANQGLLAPDQATRDLLQRMTTRGSPTMNPRGPAAQRIWLAPSFAENGPGLIRGTWQEATATERAEIRGRLIEMASPGLLKSRSVDEVFLILGFGYPDAPWAALEQAIRTHGLPGEASDRSKTLVIWQPPGLVLTQDDFDLALQSADLNFVRGEDSFVRAHWAAASVWQVPFVWQPYRQAEQAHADKLQGWLKQLLDDEALDGLNHFHWAFNQLAGPGHSPASIAEAWRVWRDQWALSQSHLHRVTAQLATRPSLEDHLLQRLHTMGHDDA